MVALTTTLPSVTAARLAADRAARAAASREDAAYDAVLVTRFLAGDESAFAEIMTRYRGKMFHVALGLLRNRGDAEEIAQDTFIRAHRALAQFRGETSLAAWLYRITANLSHNRYWYFFRRRRHAMIPLDAAVSDGNTATLAEVVASDAPNPAREAMTDEFALIVTACTVKLTPDQQKILALRNSQHCTYSEISRSLGVGIGTVKSRIARARNNLRILVSQAYPEFLSESSPFTCFESVRGSGQLEAISA